MMALDLNSGDYKLFRDSFRKYVETELKPNYEKWEEEGLVPREAWRKCGEKGFLCPWAGEEYGGAGVDFGYSAIIIEELARHGTNTLFTLHSDIVVPYINSFGNPSQKERWLPGCVSGELIAAVAMTEPNAGSDLASITTTARRDGDYYVLNGAKTFISGGHNCSLVIVACKTDPQATPAHRGVSLIVVEDGTPGFIKGRKLKKMGLKSQDTTELFFEDCRVPAENLLGNENAGFIYLMQKLQQERLVCAISAQATAEKMLKEVLEYTGSRTIFGKPVSAFQHNSFKLVEMATEIELGRVFIERLIEDHMENKNVVKRVSMAKYWISEMANRVAYHCLQLYGGYGYMEEYPISRDFRDIRVQTIYAGATEVMKHIIAKEMGL
jgi:acyl-CoA dehydrogenase